MDFNTEVPICMQDTIHICTKLKTRLTKPGAEIILGKFKVSPAHIEKLIELHPKDQHMLSLSCLDSKNYLFLLNIYLYTLNYFICCRHR